MIRHVRQGRIATVPETPERIGRGQKIARGRFALLLPALDEFVVVDRERLFLLVLDLQLRRKVALRDGILVPVFEIVLFGAASDPCRPCTPARSRRIQHLLLLGAERIHGFLRGLGTRGCIADRLPPQLCQLRVVRACSCRSATTERGPANDRTR